MSSNESNEDFGSVLGKIDLSAVRPWALPASILDLSASILGSTFLIAEPFQKFAVMAEGDGDLPHIKVDLKGNIGADLGGRVDTKVKGSMTNHLTSGTYFWPKRF